MITHGNSIWTPMPTGSTPKPICSPTLGVWGHRYLGATITENWRCNTNVSYICTKANRTLGFLRRNVYHCPQDVKEAANKGLVRPVLKYGSSDLETHGIVLQEDLEIVQKGTARFVMGNYN